MKLRKRIKKRRAGLGISQYELADKVGFSRSHSANLENGHRQLTTEHVRVIARALHTRPGAL